ncbi:MAG: hypothetical protein IE917_08715 [Betaproteobacteria bacterium]|nr:hypothetical protein [Betaproteobacteria bacterium]
MSDFRPRKLLCAQGVFTLAFFYSLSVGLLVQLVILPFVLPALDAGQGLLKGGDWIWFQQEAVQLANRIHQEGWVVWELRPQGNAPIGIAAAAYAFTGISEPWILMPLNAGLFAVGATCLYMVFTLIASYQLAFAATMPYVLLPSAAVIFGQIHKDVWSIAGIAMVVLVWGRFSAYRILGWKDAGIQVALILTGVLLVWLVRPYLVQVVLVTSILTVFVVASTGLTRRDHAKNSSQWWFGVILSIVLPLAFMQSLSGIEVLRVSGGVEPIAWHHTELIPRPVDNALSQFAERRRAFTEGYPHAGSNVDTEVEFHSAIDLARYIPRALQIALFAPFPDMWGGGGASPGAEHMRLVAGIETTFTYFLLPGVLMVFMRREIRCTTAVALIQTTIPIVILALVVSNVGTLYRMRYAYLQLLNGLGLIGWVMWVQHWNIKFRRILG